MNYYLVTWKSKGVRHRERIKADSEEEAESKLRKLRQWRADFTIVSVKLVSKNTPLNQIPRPAPTFKQFACSFGTMNNGTYEVHQIALHAADEASARETLLSTYPGIVIRTIRIVEVN